MLNELNQDYKIIQLAFKLRNMEKTWWKKNGGTKNVTIDCSSSTFTAQTPVQNSKGWNGHHPKSAAHSHHHST